MASIYSKFLWPVTITASNNTLGYNDGAPKTVSMTVTSFDSILEVLSNLQTQLGAGYTCAVNELGKVTITRSSGWDVAWGTTDDPLETLLGFDGTEKVDASNVLTATNQHTHGYYPGLLSFGYSIYRGAGISGDTLWLPIWPMVRTLSGNNAQCIVGPASAKFRCNLDFNPIKRTEVENTSVGLYGFWNSCITQAFRFYPDRSVGVVGTVGTQDTDYFSCTLLEDPKVNHVNALLYNFSLSLNKEPAES